MGQEKGKPGVMLYFDKIDSLELLSNEQLGILMMRILLYASRGDEPNFEDPMLRILWPIIRSDLDRDDERYNKRVENARLSVEKRQARRSKINNFLAESVSLSPGIRRALQEIAMETEEEQVEQEEEKTPPPKRSEAQPPQDDFEARRQQQIQRLQHSGY